MKSKYFAWTLCILLVVAWGNGSARAAGRNWNLGSLDPTRISVVIEEDAPLSPAVSAALNEELERIFSPADILLELVSPDLNSHPVWDSQVIITRIVGKCQIGAMPPLHPHHPDTLGRTMVTDGVILPFIEIDCRQVSGAVRGHILGKPGKQRDRLLGRAIARVLAHEIYHVLARTHEHAPRGVAAESIRSNDLVSERLDFRFEDFERMELVPVMATN